MYANSSSSFHLGKHDHRRCISVAIANAEKICEHKGLRFTKTRRRVLQLIWASHSPAVAYDLLQQLRREKHNAEPPTIYRALTFLLDNHLAHKIESLSAYIGCTQPGYHHAGQFLICSACKQTAELVDTRLQQVLQAAASRAGLEVSHQTVEIIGRCSLCRAKS